MLSIVSRTVHVPRYFFWRMMYVVVRSQTWSEIVRIRVNICWFSLYIYNRAYYVICVLPVFIINKNYLFLYIKTKELFFYFDLRVGA